MKRQNSKKAGKRFDESRKFECWALQNNLEGKNLLEYHLFSLMGV